MCDRRELSERERPSCFTNNLEPTDLESVMMPLKDLDPTKPFCSPQDQIQWGILFLNRQLRSLSPSEREPCLKDVWEWARRRADLLCLQMIRDYRECCKESGPTYRRHKDWLLSNWNNPEFWAEWEKRFPRSGTERTAEGLGGKLKLS